MNAPLVPHPDVSEADRITSIAVLAVGGQGGGVLTDWITDVAERNGYRAQSTSVAGVAQRTGATIYYIEMCPDRGRQPVFSLSPSQGDVDVLIAAELMEAGRAIMRGFVTPGRTTLIASSHRIAAVSEKIVPGDGRGSSEEVNAAARKAAKAFISFDMERMAVEAGSVISASLFGALAGSGVLPFARESYEETIRASGRGVEASLRAFSKAFERAGQPDTDEAAAIGSGQGERDSIPAPNIGGAPGLVAEWQRLLARIDALPAPVREMAGLGLRKVVDFQDLAYGGEYLHRLDQAVRRDREDQDFEFSTTAAKYLANAMCYDDVVRVADLKTRSTRSARVRREVGVSADSVLQVTEYFHPRIEEVCGSLPAGLGRWIEARPELARWLDRRINKGRRIRTDSAFGFSILWLVGGLRRWRRALLRHTIEVAHLERWFELALSRIDADYKLAVEILKCRRLIKGYSDTHARGLSKYDRVLSGLSMLEGRADAAEWLGRLREAALKDEKGEMLDGALKTVASFAGPSS